MLLVRCVLQGGEICFCDGVFVVVMWLMESVVLSISAV